MVRLLFLSLLFLYSGSMTFAQYNPGFQVQHFTTDNGMPSNGIKGMQWDETTGFLWVATEAGVARFNGREFNNFTKENSPVPQHERMAYLIKNNRGEIFGADVGNHIMAVNANRVLPFSSPAIESIAGFRKKHFLTITGERLLQSLASFSENIRATPWNDVHQLSDSGLLMLSNFGKYFYIRPGHDPVALQLPFKTERNFVLDNRFFVLGPDRKIFLADSGFQQFSPLEWVSVTGETIPFLSPNFLLYWENGMERPILFAGNNAWLLDYRNNRIEARLVCNAVPTFSFIRFAQYSEKYKTLFIGTDSKGIIVIRKNKLTLLKNKGADIRERNAYYSQIELSNGNVLTNEAHIIGPHANKNEPVPVNGKFEYSIYKSGDSLLWFAQYEKAVAKSVLHCYDYRTGKTKVFEKIQVFSNFGFYQDGNRIYIANSNGLGYLQGDSLFLLYKPNEVPSNLNSAYALTLFAPDLLGVASCDGVILYRLSNKKTDTLLKAEGSCFRNFWKYRDYIFIGSYGKGWYIWKNGKLKQMPVDKNKFLLYAHCFTADNQGFCWISTNRGLFKAGLNDLLYAWENNRNKLYYHYYGRNDGMEITEMNGGCAPCVLAMQNGTLSFPTMDGLLWVQPEADHPVLPEGEIYIDEVLAGKVKISPDSLGKLDIPFNAGELTVKLGFSSWCNRENIYLEYRVNKDSNWSVVDMSNGAQIRFNNLDPGTYLLTIRKINGFGTNNFSYKEIRFSISTPWTRSWWFYLLLFGAAWGILVLYFRFRTRRLKQRQKKLEQLVVEKTKELQDQNAILEKNNSIKTRLISIISHDIVTPLKFLTAAGKNLIEKRKLMPEELQQETIGEMTNTSQELQLLSTNILNWIKYQNENRRMLKEKFNIHEMVNQVLGILQSLARQKNLIISNETDPSTEIVQYYEPLKILLYNLLTNSIRYTDKGSIRVNARYDGSSVILSVTDEGIGMSAEQVQKLLGEEVVISAANIDHRRGHGLGFLIIKDLVKTMGASLDIKSKKEAGTTVLVKLPGKSAEGG